MAQAVVVFTRLAGGRYAVHAHRRDGVVVVMPPSDRTFRVPHDLALFAVERELGLRHGVFGTVMAGGLFATMRIVAGRRRHDDRARGTGMARAPTASYAVTVAEALAGVVHHAVETGDHDHLLTAAREQWGITCEDRFPYTRAQVEGARRLLDDLHHRWGALTVGEHMALPWTPRRAPSRAR